MFSYLHAIVSPTGVYAATDDFGAQEGSALRQRITKAAADFARLVQGCGAHQRRDVFAEELVLDGATARRSASATVLVCVSRFRSRRTPP